MKLKLALALLVCVPSVVNASWILSGTGPTTVSGSTVTGVNSGDIFTYNALQPSSTSQLGVDVNVGLTVALTYTTTSNFTGVGPSLDYSLFSGSTARGFNLSNLVGISSLQLVASYDDAIMGRSTGNLNQLGGFPWGVTGGLLDGSDSAATTAATLQIDNVTTIDSLSEWATNGTGATTSLSSFSFPSGPDFVGQISGSTVNVSGNSFIVSDTGFNDANGTVPTPGPDTDHFLIRTLDLNNNGSAGVNEVRRSYADTFTLTLDADSEFTANDTFVYSFDGDREFFVPVPEPSSLSLFAFALGGLFLRRNRR